MEKVQSVPRRSVLAGLAALAIPLPTLSSQALQASPVPAMAETHETARRELVAANAAAEPAYAAFHAANDAAPIMVQLPGFRFGHQRSLRVTRTSPAAIRELYASDYGMGSGKSGLLLSRGAMTLVDYAADQARDLAQALANHEAATLLLGERARTVGLTAAQQRIDAACEALESAWVALLSYVPRTLPELHQKAGAVLAIVTADPVQLDDEHSAILLRSLAEGGK